MLSKNLESSLHRALAIASSFSHEYTTLEHLLLSLLEDPDAMSALTACSVNIQQLSNKLKKFLKTELSSLTTKEITESKPTAGFQRVIHRAAIHIHALGKREITGTNVLAEIFSEQDSFAVLFLMEQNVTRHDIMNYISQNVTKSENEPERDAIHYLRGHISRQNEESEEVSSTKEEKENSPLGKYCINLNKMALENKLDVLIDRDAEVERTVEILCRRNKNNPLLVGEPGVGKTAIVEGLAIRLARGDVPEPLRNTVIFALDMGALVAGTRYRGDFEERIKTVLKEIQKIPSAILFIDEIHTIIGAGSTNGSALDAGNLLKPALSRGQIRCIGSTTFKEYQNHFEKDQALERRFQRIVVEEPDIESACKMLNGLKPFFEKHHGVKYTSEAIRASVILSDRYINDRHLPDKAIDVMDEAGAHLKLTNNNNKKVVKLADIESTVSKIVHIPAHILSQNDVDRLKNLDKRLKSAIFGQDRAVEELVSAIKLSHAGLRRHPRPIGCYLFAGPTGVGKTELAKQLAKEINMSLVRLDMSEYMESHSVSRLLGSPPGYVGFDQGGVLSDEVRKTPYSVVLLDEIEKAHPDIYNLMLQIMDYGRITDHNGRHVNFCNTIIIMTTNAGAAELSQNSLGFNSDKRESRDNGQIERLFSPEFRNRLDAIVHFDRLNKDIVKLIVDKLLSELGTQVAEKGIKLNFSKSVKDFLCNSGLNVDNGAREIDRSINDAISKNLADEILFGKLKKGGNVQIYMDHDRMKFDFEAS